MAECSLLAGLAGAMLARSGSIWLGEPLYSAVPRAKHVAFLADWWAHTASYAAGVVGGCVLVARTWTARRS